MEHDPRLLTCCGRAPYIIGDGIAPSYGTAIGCAGDCERHVFVPNMKGTGGTRDPAIKQWNDQL